MIRSSLLFSLLFMGMGSMAWSLPPASSVESFDHKGEDWIISESTSIAGTHYNIGDFVTKAEVNVVLIPYR